MGDSREEEISSSDLAAKTRILPEVEEENEYSTVVIRQYREMQRDLTS